MNDYEKYTKYKSKYLNLKKKLEGGAILNIQKYNKVIKVKDLTKNSFALAVSYKDNNNSNKHITLAYFTNFPMSNNLPVKNVLEKFIEIWIDILKTSMPNGGFTNYNIRSSNSLFHTGGKSIWFLPTNKYGLNNLIQLYHNNSNFTTLKNTLTNTSNTTINYPNKINNQNITIYSHSDSGKQINNNNFQSISQFIPNSIDLSNVNIY